ncbi:Doublesex- and mab-3-related transcription like protein [Argiope bruennichi]|uniref:Doublesex- and mab-3-related transcription like protein n=1 Tax=Argiope bruennichi TaxID=94029 RepID=A0A8T0FDJ7_ARGBR|nr:Doublesex- and mab-3-related transcription like protein [Argiope bruennichi]
MRPAGRENPGWCRPPKGPPTYSSRWGDCVCPKGHPPLAEPSPPRFPFPRPVPQFRPPFDPPPGPQRTNPPRVADNSPPPGCLSPGGVPKGPPGLETGAGVHFLGRHGPHVRREEATGKKAGLLKHLSSTVPPEERREDGNLQTVDWKRSRLSPTETSGSPKSSRRRPDGEEATTDSEPYEDDDRASKEPESSSPPPPATDIRKPEWPPQEPLDLHHRNGAPSPEGSPTPTGTDLRNFDLHKKKSPIDILARVFPRENRSILNVVLQRNGGDVLQAIDDLLSTKEPDAEKTVTETSSDAASPSASPLSRIPSPRQPNSLGEPAPPMAGFSSPHNFFSSAPASTIAMGALPFRRPYSSSPGSRGLLAVPTYSGFFPGITPTFTPGYPNFFGTTLTNTTSTTPEDNKKKVGDCWPACGNPSPQDLSSPDTKSPNGYTD